MKTEDLRAFDAVVRHGSLSEAARVMSLTQPAITRRIQNLEEALGAQLLDRSTKPPLPSVLGLRVHQQTRAALREIDALASLVATDAAPTGQLRLGLTHSMGSLGLIDVLSGLQRAFPDVRMQISTDWSARLVDRVAHGKLDAATVFLPAKTLLPEGLGGQRLASTEVLVVAPQGRFAQRAGKLAGSAAAGWILNPEGCGFRASLQRGLADLGLPFQLVLETFGSELQLGLVAAGMGLGFVTRRSLEASRYADAVDVLTPRDFKLVVDVWLVGPAHQGNLHRPVQHFGELVAASFHAPASASAEPPRRARRAPAPSTRGG